MSTRSDPPDSPLHDGDRPARERLERSRAHLHGIWRATRAPAADVARPAGARAPSLADAALSAASRWWRQHPWRTSGTLVVRVAEPAARAALAPIAQQRPLTVLAVAAAGGALLVWSRPWRWLPQAALSSALLSMLWPRGSFRPWLDAGGQWLAGDGLARVLADFAASPPTATAPANAGTPTARAHRPVSPLP